MVEENKPGKLESYEEDEIGIGRKLKSRKSSKNSNTLWISFLLIVVIIGSFWLSFSIGKRLINPVRKLPDTAIKEDLPPSGAVYPAMPSLEVIDGQYTPEVIGEDLEEPIEPAPKPKMHVVQKIEENSEELTPVLKKQPKRLFKVQTEVVADKTDAQSLSSRLNDAGIDCFIKAVSNGFLIQVGAYSKKEGAESFVAELKTKGFNAKVVLE